MTKRAVLYARVSKEDSRNVTSSLTSQLEMCREYAQEKGWQVVEALAEDDRGASGASFDLPKLGRALELARAGEIDVLVVRELDRFARGLAKQLIIEGEFRRYGVTIEYVQGEYPDTPEGALNKNIKAVIAEYERLKIAERMTRGRRQSVKAGNVLTHGAPPYGYKTVKKEDGRTKLEIDEEAAIVVRMIFNWYAHDGYSLNEVLRQLNALRLPTPTDIRNTRGTKKRKAWGEWSKATVHNILNNETYAGTWHYGKRNGQGLNADGYQIAVTVPALIDQETWAAVQTRRATNKVTSPRNTKYDYLLKGMGVCGHCGYKMQAHSYVYKSRVNKTRYFYYRCPVRAYPALYSPSQCDLPTFRVEEVDNAVWQWVTSFLANPDNLARGMNYYLAEREAADAPLKARLEGIQSLIADNRRQLERLLDLYLSGDYAREILIERKSRLEDTIAALEQQGHELVRQLEQTLTREQIEGIQSFADGIARGLDTAAQDFSKRRQVIEQLELQVTFAVEEGEKVLYLRCALMPNTVSIASDSTRFPGRAAADRQARG
ncbi:MAG: recombinase family protein [Anaerolineales bacterium]|nr:recombinase family protein [Anaerolineales bacterium]